MNKYLLPFILVSKCLFSCGEHVDRIPASCTCASTHEALTPFLTELRAADVQWRNHEKEAALNSYNALLEKCTSPVFTIAINLRKGVLEAELGREEEANRSLRSSIEPIFAMGDLSLDEKLCEEKTLGECSVTALMKALAGRDLCPR